jgi:phosphate transport system substrate-binding protein
VENGTYPLARPLFIYSTAAIMQAEKPQVAAFINFYLTYVQEEVLSCRLLPGQYGRFERSPRTLVDRQLDGCRAPGRLRHHSTPR